MLFTEMEKSMWADPNMCRARTYADTTETASGYAISEDVPRTARHPKTHARPSKRKLWLSSCVG